MVSPTSNRHGSMGLRSAWTNRRPKAGRSRMFDTSQHGKPTAYSTNIVGVCSMSRILPISAIQSATPIAGRGSYKSIE